MEPPVRADGESIRDEKVKVLKAIPALTVDTVRCRERLGGLLRYYHRAA